VENEKRKVNDGGDPVTSTAVVPHEAFQPYQFVPSADLDWDTTQGFWDALMELEDQLPWWIGGILNTTEAKWGETYSQLIDLTGKSYERLSQYASVEARVPPENRILCAHTKLTWTHCQLVSKFDTKTQKEWLERAIDESWGTRELKDAIRQSEKVDRLALDPKSPPEVSAEKAQQEPESGLDDEVDVDDIAPEVHDRVPDGEFMKQPIRYRIDAESNGLTVRGPEELLIALANVVEG